MAHKIEKWAHAAEQPHEIQDRKLNHLVECRRTTLDSPGFMEVNHTEVGQRGKLRAYEEVKQRFGILGDDDRLPAALKQPSMYGSQFLGPLLNGNVYAALKKRVDQRCYDGTAEHHEDTRQ